MAGSTNTSDKSGLVRRQQRRRKGTLTFEKLGKVPVGSNVGFEQRMVKKEPVSRRGKRSEKRFVSS
jgi:hypothetical protein